VDADELAGVAGATLRAIREATTYAEAKGIDDEFREILRYCRDMHELLREAMEEAPELVNDELRAYCNDTDADIRALGSKPGELVEA